jgi:hypothetical protein
MCCSARTPGDRRADGHRAADCGRAAQRFSADRLFHPGFVLGVTHFFVGEDRGLGAHRGQPRHRLIEAVRVPRAVPRPRHRRHDHPVHRAAHPRRVSLHERLHRAQIQRPPPPASLTTVVAGAAPPAQSAPPPLTPHRPHRRHDHTLLLVEYDTLNHRLLDAEQPSP